MKKFTLMLLAAASIGGQMQAQTTLIVDAPKTDLSSSSVSGPNGTSTHKYMRAAWLVLKSELTDFAPFTNSVVTTFGFNLLNGVSGTGVSGNFTVYLLNTPSNTYTLGGNWTNIVATMGTPHFVGTLNIPPGTNTTVTDVTLTNPFTYTGDGILVAYDFENPGATATSPAWYLANTTGIQVANDAGVREFSSLSAPATLTATIFRPSFRFGAGNTATNELSVDQVIANGVVAELEGAAQNIGAVVKNRSSVLQTNIDVVLTITGANPYTNTITVSSLAAGISTNVVFTGYNPTNAGVSYIDVNIPNDQNNNNNEQSWGQELTCNMIGIHPGNMTYTAGPNNLQFNTSYGFGGTTGSGYFLAKHSVSKTTTLTGVQLAVGANGANVNKQVYGVLLDASGNLVGQTAAQTIPAAGAFLSMNFSPTQPLIPNLDYYIGVAQPASGYYLMAAREFTNFPIPNYYFSPIGGGTIQAIADPFIFGITPILKFDEMVLTASASKTYVCKGDEVTFSVSAQPNVTFTWSPGGSNAATITTTLQPPGTQTSAVIVYQVVGTHSTGCMTETAQRSVSVSICTGMGDDLADYKNIIMFPNPAVSGITTLSGLQGENQIDVVNLIGQTVFSMNTSRESQQIDISAFPAGQYFIKVANNKQQVKVFKLLNE